MIGEDTVCLSPQACAKNLSMLVVKESWGLSGLRADGIMGMSPTSQRGDAELMIEELYNQKVIDEKVFSI